MHGDSPGQGFVADLEFLENRDLDLSVRLGALLAFNALMITIGTHPVSASPGAPLSLDVAKQSWLVAASLFAILPFVASSVLCLRALLIGEDFDDEGGSDPQVLRQRLYTAFIVSLDAQSRAIEKGVRWTLTGGGLTAMVWVAILIAKL